MSATCSARSTSPATCSPAELEQRKTRAEFLAFCTTIRARYPNALRLAFVLDNFSVYKGDQMRAWEADNNVELAYTPHYASWLNRIEPQFKGLRYFCLAGTDHPDHETQARLIDALHRLAQPHRDNPKTPPSDPPRSRPKTDHARRHRQTANVA